MTTNDSPQRQAYLLALRRQRRTVGRWQWALALGLLGAWEFRKNWIRLKTEDKNP